MTAGNDPCPLCGSSQGSPRLRIPYDEVWAALRAKWGVSLSEEVRRRHQLVPESTLVRCDRCALEYFSPIAAGDGAFYQELMADMPYNADRWEFGVVERSLPPGADVVDLGCGAGAFLRRIAQRVRRTVGVDHNEDAIADLRSHGVEAYASDFERFARREGRAFDVVCSFHTLEHLPRVDVLLEPAVACAREGGRIFISVPNRDRFGRESLEPLDCPPHHVSRWSPQQFRAIAERHGLELSTVRFEEPDLSHARLWLGQRLLSRTGLSGVIQRRALAETVGRLALSRRRYSRAARAGRFASAKVFGHSMIAEFRVPTGRGGFQA